MSWRRRRRWPKRCGCCRIYDEVVIDKERRNDPEVVLEGYTKIWHYDRETHVLTVSDEITGEDGLVEFDGASEDGKVLYDGLGLTLTSGPLARVDVSAEFTWTQQARGTVDLTEYLLRNWPDKRRCRSYTLDAGDWPKPVPVSAMAGRWRNQPPMMSRFLNPQRRASSAVKFSKARRQHVHDVSGQDPDKIRRAAYHGVGTICPQ